MKILYILAALMLIGALLMFVSSMKVLDEMNKSKIKKFSYGYHRHTKPKTPVTKSPEIQAYLIAGYLGITFFAVGALGALFVVVQTYNRRF